MKLNFFMNEGKNFLDHITVNKLNFFNMTDLTKLKNEGYFVRENYIDNEAVIEIRKEAEIMLENGTLRSAGMSSTENYWKDETTRGDKMTWISNLNDIHSYPKLTAILNYIDTLRKELNEATELNSTSTRIQLACYPGNGSRYVKHKDAIPPINNDLTPKRRLTVLLYLNPDWKTDCGGHLRLHLKNDQVFDVEPKAGTLLIFLSRQIDHEVLPTFKIPRFAITTWFY